MRTTALYCTILMSLTFHGCGLDLFTSSESPLVEDNIGNWPLHQVGTLGVTADRRIVIVRLHNDSAGAGRFCAEPPPDAGQNVASALTTLLNVSSDKLDTNLKAELAKSLASNFQAFVKRSQGLQLYRDAMYNLCQSSLNQALDKAEVKSISAEYFQKAVDLIKHELTLTKGIINPTPQQSAPIAPPLGTVGDKNRDTSRPTSGGEGHN